MAVAVAALLKQYQALKSQRAPWEPDWRDLATYILPRKRSAIGQRPAPGEKITQRLFDSTAIHANTLLAAAMQGSLTSAAFRWFRLRMRDDALTQDSEVAVWLEDTAARTYAALQQSNWTPELFEVYLDLGAMGTGAMLIVERDDLPPGRWRGLLCRAIPIGTYCLAEDGLGRVNTLYYTLELSAAAAVERWGRDAVGPKIAKLAESRPSDLVEIIHSVFPRVDGIYGGPRGRKPWASVYLAEADKTLIEEGGYDAFPFVVPRWTKASGEVYGRGQGHTALPDIRTLNKMTELELRAIAKAIDPPLLTKHHGVIGAIRLTPGAVTTTRDDPRTSLVPLESGAKFQVGQIKSEQLKVAIRDMFFNSQLTFPAQQPMTATEIERRYELMHRVLGPTLGRLEYELTIPAIERTVRLLWTRGALRPPPPILVEAAQQDGADIDILAEGPLARAQKGSEALAIERYFQLALPLSQVEPSILDLTDFDEAARAVADATGVPAKVLRSPAAVAALRAQRQEADAQAAAMAQVQQLAQGARNVAPLLKAVAPQGLAPEASAAPSTAAAA